ncbi:unnamed protein product [Dimorphilus gyrociliatus]|uniref:Uncharacterized protein n=1 Tax=Dimorphilus gyrociliatus TaxID=2664684 RepID=A0A7I8VKP5_9ANNE|nr:unnamed protein product [Dimorphilus gyrociliatus]
MGCGSTRIHTTPVSNGRQHSYIDFPLVRRSRTQFSHLSASIQNDEESVKIIMSPDCSTIQIEMVSFGLDGTAEANNDGNENGTSNDTLQPCSAKKDSTKKPRSVQSEKKRKSSFGELI